MHFKVAGYHLCPPRSVLIDAPAWVPKEIGGDGFAFRLPPEALFATGKYVPLRDLLGRNVGHSMSVGSDGVARRWAEGGESLEAHLRKLPFFEAELYRSGKYRILYDSPTRASWWVVSIPEAPRSSGEEPAPSAIVAHCAVETLPTVAIGQHRITQNVCARYAVADGLEVSYSFEYSNLPQIAELDREVIAIVMSWTCDGKQAGAIDRNGVHTSESMSESKARWGRPIFLCTCQVNGCQVLPATSWSNDHSCLAIHTPIAHDQSTAPGTAAAM